MNQDYVLRMIRQIAAALAAIMSKRRSGQVEEAQQEVAKTFEQTLGLPLELVRDIPPDALTSLLEGMDSSSSFRKVLVGELFLQDAELLEESGKTGNAQASRMHAFFLLSGSFASLSKEDQVEYRPRIDALAEKLESEGPNVGALEKIRAWLAKPRE